MQRIAYGILLAITAGLFIAFLGWATPTLTALGHGLQPFDLRMQGGYSFDDAVVLLLAYGQNGVDFYLGVFRRLDFVLPAALAGTIYFGIVALVPERLDRWRHLIAAIAIPGAIFDYLENIAVDRLLTEGVSAITPQQVAMASLWTELKGGFLGLSMLLLGTLIALRVIAWIGSRDSRRA